MDLLRGRASRTDGLPEGTIRVPTKDGATIAVQCLAADGELAQAVVVTHGTFSDRRSCLGIARHLAKSGFACCSFEWRGHGLSGAGRAHATFEDIARHDVSAALEAVRALTGRDRFFWVGHSGGGFLPWMFVAREGSSRGIEGVVALGAQTTGAGASLRGRAAILASSLMTKALGYTPSLGVGPQNEYAGVMRQWFAWNRTRRWHGEDGFDYGAALAKVALPALFVAGAGDTLIAPEHGCRALHDAVGTDDKTFVLCGRSTGFAEDYAHGRLVTSASAAREVWPLVTAWLLERASTT